MKTLDIFVQNYFSATRTPSLTEFFYVVTSTFDLSLHSFSISLFFAVLIYFRKNIKYSLFFLATLSSGAVIVYFMKVFFNVSRPANALFDVFGQSFPSYHATVSTIFFLLVIYIFSDYFNGFYRKVFNSLCVISIFLVSSSRLYLGVHWFSDVFFGVIIGAVISYLAILIFKNVINVQGGSSVIK